MTEQRVIVAEGVTKEYSENGVPVQAVRVMMSKKIMALRVKNTSRYAIG